MAKQHTKPESDMTKNMAFVRVFIDPEATARLKRMADAEGRTLQRQMGMILEAVARLYRDDPQKLESLGLLSKFALANVA